MRPFGVVLFWLGVLLCIGSVVVGLVLGGRTVDQVRTALSDAVPMAGGTATVELAAGGQRGIYEVTGSDSPGAECTVEGADGSTVPVRERFDLGGATGTVGYAYVGDFEAPTAGAYTVTCAGGQTVLGPSLDVGSLGGGVLGILAGVAGFLLGLFLVLLGGVLWLVGRSRDRKAALRGSYGGPPGYEGRPPPPPSW